MALLSLAAIPVLHWAERGAGVATPTPQARAWIGNATHTALGVEPGQDIQFVVVAPSDRRIRWASFEGGHPSRSGMLQGRAGTEFIENVSTSTASPGTWFTIRISGIATPLRVWIS